ncbi:MAG TPA: hypothetical protein ACHBX0_12415 [Arsenophonus sp.]
MSNFHGYDNARSHRIECRRAKQKAYDRNKALNMALRAALHRTNPSNQQTDSGKNRPILSLKTKKE